MSNYLIAYNPADGGAKQQLPTLRVYRSRVTRGADGQSVGRAAPEPYWMPQVLRWQSNGQVSTLELKRVLGAGPGQGRRRPEDVPPAAGDQFRLVEVLSSQFGSTQREWFRGPVARQEVLIQAGPAGDAEECRVTAYGPELLLAQQAVLGQWFKKPSCDAQEVAGTLTAEDSTRENCWESRLPCVFNADGEPNASASAWKLDSDAEHYAPQAGELACRTFEPPGRTVRDDSGNVKLQAQYWTAYTALRSLIEWVDRYRTISWGRTNWDAVAATLGDTPLPEVRVQGMTLLEALAAVLAPMGFGFAIEPWAQADAAGHVAHRLLVFSLSQPAETKEPSLADNAAGNVSVASPAGRRATVQRLHFVRDYTAAADEIHVLGDQKRVQVDLDFGGGSQSAWDLRPYWDTTAHDLSSWLSAGEFNPRAMPDEPYTFEAFHDQYDAGGSQYELNRHVFRSFAWNEDGALAPLVAEVPDLSGWGDAEGNYVRRPRPVGETFTWDDADCRTRRIPAGVWMALVRGDTGAVIEESWRPVGAQVWRDRAGLTLSAAGLGQWYPWADDENLARQTVPGAGGTKYQDLHYLTLLARMLAGSGGTTLLLRLSGSIETDATLTAVGSPAAEARGPLPARRVIYAPGRFQWRVRQDTGVWGDSLPADTRDDRADASAYAQEVAGWSAAAVGRGSLTLRHLTREYAPGVGIARTGDRRIALAASPAGDRVPVVVQVTWDFARSPGKTELTLETPSLGTAP